MKNLTEFLKSNCELQEEEMKQVNGGDGLTDIANDMATSTIQTGITAYIWGEDLMERIYPEPWNDLL